mmetsp:Transcript_18846/g.64848  ORF Transcript_18846/g.64848 Transcript_18846/m.64848 type:complete len:152 (+) Transcript_18846:141-596(+)
MYGYKIIKAIGVELIAVTPSRGSCIELGAAFVIIHGSSQGWPLSTTHCQVGAAIAVGLFDGARSVAREVGMSGWRVTGGQSWHRDSAASRRHAPPPGSGPEPRQPRRRPSQAGRGPWRKRHGAEPCLSVADSQKAYEANANGASVSVSAPP